MSRTGRNESVSENARPRQLMKKPRFKYVFGDKYFRRTASTNSVEDFWQWIKDDLEKYDEESSDRIKIKLVVKK